MTDLPDEECQGEHSFDFFKHTRFFFRKMASPFFQIYLVLKYKKTFLMTLDIEFYIA